jgi:hypothetical protein
MVTLLSTGNITAAQSTAYTKPDAVDLASQRGLLLQANFAYGSGGTSVDAWVQSTADGGATWYDVANFHFTTAAAIKLANLRAQTPVTTIATPTVGTLSSNTTVDGLLGDQIRVQWSSQGTYGGTTTLTITAIAR